MPKGNFVELNRSNKDKVLVADEHQCYQWIDREAFEDRSILRTSYSPEGVRRRRKVPDGLVVLGTFPSTMDSSSRQTEIVSAKRQGPTWPTGQTSSGWPSRSDTVPQLSQVCVQSSSLSWCQVNAPLQIGLILSSW